MHTLLNSNSWWKMFDSPKKRTWTRPRSMALSRPPSSVNVNVSEIWRTRWDPMIISTWLGKCAKWKTWTSRKKMRILNWYRGLSSSNWANRRRFKRTDFWCWSTKATWPPALGPYLRLRPIGKTRPSVANASIWQAWIVTMCTATTMLARHPKVQLQEEIKRLVSAAWSLLLTRITQGLATALLFLCTSSTLLTHQGVTVRWIKFKRRI